MTTRVTVENVGGMAVGKSAYRIIAAGWVGVAREAEAWRVETAWSVGMGRRVESGDYCGHPYCRQARIDIVTHHHSSATRTADAATAERLAREASEDMRARRAVRWDTATCADVATEE